MLSFGFYNSKGGDRVYDAEQIGAMFNGLITDGVFANYKEALRVTVGDGPRKIVVHPGRAWFNGTWTEVDDDGHNIFLGASFEVDATFYICLAVSKKSRFNSIAYYKNIPENNPDTGLYYYLLAQINIPAGSDRITDSMITDTRGSDLCPYVTGIMETVSFEEIVKQVCGDNWQDWLGVYEAGITTGVQNAVRASSEALSEVKSLKAYSVESEAVSYTWAKFEAIATGGGGFEWATDSVHTELVDPPMPMCLFRDLSYADLGAGSKPNISLRSPYKPDGETTMKPVPASTQAKVWKEYPYFWEGGGAYGTEVLRYDDLQRVIVTSAGVATEKYRYRISRLVHLPVTYEPGAYMGTVTADNATAYPRDGYKDGYWYVRFAAKAEDVSFYYPGLSAKNVQDAIIEVARTGGTGGGSAMSVIEVEELPPTGIPGVMYVVKKSGDSDAAEYLWLDRWEKVGGTESGSNNDVADMFGGYDRFYRSIARGRVNPEEPLVIDTYDGSGQLTHPCVRHFPEGFGGHSWWMTASPYPNSALELENPCVWYSDDGIHWSADGIPNPLDEPLYVTGEQASMNSDPHLLVRPDGVMEVWWRTNYWENSGEGLYTVVYRRTSTDGVNWTAKEELHRMLTNSADGIVCPVALYEDGVYKIWAVSDQECLRYYESATGADWRHIRDIDVSNPDYSEYKVWHFDVNHTAKGYEFVGCYNIPGDYSSPKYLYYAVSQDNLTYSKRVMILTRGETGRFDERLVYRPTIVRLEDRVRIYYGANNADNVWSIGFIEAPSAYLFNAVLISGVRVGAIESRQERLDGRVTALEAQGGGGDDRPADEGVTVVRSFDESPWLPGYWDPINDGALTLYSNMHRTQLVELASLTVDGELPEITAKSSVVSWPLVRFNYFDGNLRWIGADMGELIDPGAGTQEPTRLTWPAGSVYVAISANTADKSTIAISGVPEGSTGSGQNVTYAGLSDKPKINGVELSGDKTAEELGIGQPTDEQVGNAVGDWLEAHPEATTVVADGSITVEKTTFIEPVSDNLIDMNKVVKGYQGDSGVPAGGSLPNTSVGCTTAYIQVEAGSIYTSSPDHGTGGIWTSWFYDAGKNPLAAVSSRTFTVPDGAAYVRLSYALNTDISTLRLGLYRGANPMVYTQGVQRYGLDPLLSAAIKAVHDSNSVFKVTAKNLYKPAADGTIDSATGKFTLTGGSLNISDYIEVTPGIYYASNCFGAPAYSAAYDKNREYISAFSDAVEWGTNAYYDGGFYRVFKVIDPNVRYIVNGSSKSLSTPIKTPFIVRGNAIPDSLEGIDISTESVAYIEAAKKLLGITGNDLAGLTWAVLGDSITAASGLERSYHSIIAQKLGLTAINYGYNGSWISYTDAMSEGNEMCVRYATMTDDADVITCLGGINDINNNAALGQMGDTENTTFYGAMDLLIRGLLGKYPGKRIGFITPLRYGDGAKAEPYIEAIHTVCEKYAVPVLDLYREGMVSTATAELSATYFKDSLPPNELGHDVIARKVEAFLRRL